MARGSLFRIAGVGVALAWSGLGAADENAGWTEASMVTLTNGQVVHPDLSDPGLEGAITVRVARHLPRRLRRELRGKGRGSFDEFGGPISLLSSTFPSPPMTTRYDGRSRTVRLEPTLPMAPGQYTLTIQPEVMVPRHYWREGMEAYSLSFIVGNDFSPPEVRDSVPAPNQSEVPLHAAVIVTFNESLDAASVVHGSTVFVEDAGVDPPVPVAGLLMTKRDNFDLSFEPDAATGFPPSTRIRVRILGGGGTDAVRDRVGNALAQDFVLEFDTKAE